MDFLLLNSGGATGGLGERLSEAFMPPKVDFLGFAVSPGFVSAMIISGALIVLALVLRFTVISKMTNVPNKIQSFLEMLVNMFSNIAKEQTQEFSPIVSPYIFVASTYICIGTLVELLGIRPVFSDVNACAALGLSTFVLINVFALKKKGPLGRALRYKNPIIAVTDLAVPLSMTVRLFGSIVSGFLIMEMLYFTIFLSIGLPAVISVITTLLHAFVQAYVFALLTSLFIGEAIE